MVNIRQTKVAEAQDVAWIPDQRGGGVKQRYLDQHLLFFFLFNLRFLILFQEAAWNANGALQAKVRALNPPYFRPLDLLLSDQCSEHTVLLRTSIFFIATFQVDCVGAHNQEIVILNRQMLIVLQFLADVFDGEWHLLADHGYGLLVVHAVELDGRRRYEPLLPVSEQDLNMLNLGGWLPVLQLNGVDFGVAYLVFEGKEIVRLPNMAYSISSSESKARLGTSG